MQTTTHATKHPAAGTTVRVRLSCAEGGHEDHAYHLEDWWERVGGESSRTSRAIAAVMYRLRAEQVGLPDDDEVVYGKIGALGHLVHVTEIVNE